MLGVIMKTGGASGQENTGETYNSRILARTMVAMLFLVMLVLKSESLGTFY